ncbi:carbohydrate-binding module family 13 protein [Rhizopogon vinicolor AM-OR11-026]|uniref:Carbohydrate-binding module family 13 protein n=1 Tax=Rhizopogon vinicolor AM-OR11-026 TaxID=1314800 RepID=A0A1B7MQC3_9AGAM|nr:carbohydrate-binding module family 13 protein [Rhizopogon vinicolor AM-OR11-026]
MACIQDQHTYTLTNCEGGTVLDLSGGDNRSIIGYHDHGGPNQSWIFQRDDSGDNIWYIKSAGSGQFLGMEGHINDIRDGTKVVAVSSPFRWNIEDSDISGVQGIRILAHGTVFSVDLSDHGNSTEGTKVELWGRWTGPNQIWAVKQRNWCVDLITQLHTVCIDVDMSRL